jgi:hypothetical protein
MKRIVPILLLGLALSAGSAVAAGIGAGFFGGASFPVVQEDAKSGTLFGVRVPVTVVPLLRLEPYWTALRPGDVEETFGGLSYTRDGGEISSFGLNAILAAGGPLRFYPYAGLGSYRLTREASDDRTELGYDLGLGLGVSPLPGLELDLRGEFVMITLDETSRKFANVTLGASYHFFDLP